MWAQRGSIRRRTCSVGDFRRRRGGPAASLRRSSEGPDAGPRPGYGDIVPAAGGRAGGRAGGLAGGRTHVERRAAGLRQTMLH